MRCDKKSMLLYAVTDRAWLGEKTLAEQVESALKGGATCVQLREKNLDEESFLAEAFAVKKLCREYGVPFIINDNVEIAVKCGADGVHVGQSDMEAGNVRSIVGDDMIIGVSVHNVDEALAAVDSGADYLGIGAVFSTATKLDAGHVAKDTVRAVCRAVSVPVVAIGGITKENISELAGCGIDGVALVSAIFAAEDIESECRRLKQLSEKMISE